MKQVSIQKALKQILGMGLKLLLKWLISGWLKGGKEHFLKELRTHVYSKWSTSKALSCHEISKTTPLDTIP